MNLYWVSAIAFIVGAALAYLIRSVQVARLAERLSSYEKLFQEERNTKEKIQGEFKLAASETLQQTATQFLESAIKDMRQVKTEADSSLESKKQEIASSVSDMKSRLGEYQENIKKFEAERSELYGRVEKSLSQVLSAEQSIRMETSALKRVLTASTGVRGKWGEKVLQEILEQNNLVRGIHFDTQVFISGESDDARPDFVIHLPGGKRMIVDSKEVAGEYVLAQDCEDPVQQAEHYQKLVVNIRNNFIKLSRKEYQSLLDPDVPFVVMFIPSEAAIRAAFATDPDIFQDAASKRVILSSPMTIVPLIYLVSHSWRQHQLADNARELGDSVEELGNRLFKFIEHMHGIQQGLKKAAEGWNKAVGSWQTRVEPQIEKAKSLGAKLKESEEFAPIESELRSLEENLPDRAKNISIP